MTDIVKLSAQAPALATIIRVAQQNPGLPGAYIVSSSVVPGELTIQLDSVAEVEAWREALHVAAGDVICTDRGSEGHSWLEFWAAVEETSVHVYTRFTVAAREAEGAAA